MCVLLFSLTLYTLILLCVCCFSHSVVCMRRLFDDDGGEFELRIEAQAPADDVMLRLLRDGPLKTFLEGEGVLQRE